MKPVLFIQNGETDRPGLFARVLEEQGIALEVIHPWQGESIPASVGVWSGLAIGGGAMSAYEWEEYPYLRDISMLIREAREKRTPVLGLCLGAQLMAGACGGRVFPNQQKEIGFFDLQFTPEAETDPLWRECSSLQPVHWHQDTFTLPPQAVRLASSALTQNQLYRLDDRHYGFQFHLEIDEPVLTAMIADDEEALWREGVDPQAFREKAAVILPAVEPVGRTVFTRWLELLS